jgi:hypothetical protein
MAEHYGIQPSADCKQQGLTGMEEVFLFDEPL